MEKTCRGYFSLKIGENMRKMGKEKTRPQVIAISARDTVAEHPECKRILQKPKEKSELLSGIFVEMSSKSFRLHRNKPCSLRIFFLKDGKEGVSKGKWMIPLRRVMQEKFGARLPRRIPVISDGKGYIEVPLDDAHLILEIIRRRIANFLD